MRSASRAKAIITSDVTSGTGPLAVTFNGAQSSDDGHVEFWYWDFGDGSGDQSGSLSSTVHVYRTAGTFLPRLTVVDDSGLSSSSTQAIVVASPAAQSGVQIVGLRLASSRRGKSAVAQVNVSGPNGQLISGAKVLVSWSGAVNKSAARTSSRTGNANFTSPASKAGGCFNLTVTGVTAPGLSLGSGALPTAQLCG